MTRIHSRSRTLLVLVMVLTVGLAPLAAGTALAADHTSVSIGPGGPVPAQSQGTAEVPVTANATNVSGYQANVTFDPDAVQIESVNGSDDFDSPVVNVDNEAGWVAFNDLRSEEVDRPVLATLVVNVTTGSDTTLAFVEADTKLTNATPGEIEIGDYAAGSITIDDAPPTIENFSLANPSGRDLAVSFESNESIGTIRVEVDGADDTTLNRGHFDESEENGTFVYAATYTANDGGDYTATLVTAADVAGNDGAGGENDSVSGLPDPPSSGGSSSSSSSGGGGGSSGGGSSGPSVDVSRVSANQFQVQVEDASRTEPVTIRLPSFDSDAGAGTDLQTLRVTPGGPSDFGFTAERSGEPQGDTPALDAQSGLAYFTLDHELTDDDVATARLTFRVSKERLDAWGADPASVALYRYEDGGWASYDTRVVGEDAGAYYVTATFPGLSEFAVGADRTVTPTPTETPTPADTETETETETPTSTTTTAGPPVEEAGFPLLPVLALVGVVIVVGGLLLYRRRNAGGGDTV